MREQTLAEYLGVADPIKTVAVSTVPTPVSLLATAPSKLADTLSKLPDDLLANLLELKQVLSKFRNDLLAPEQVSKQVVGFRLQLATESEQVKSQPTDVKQVSKQVTDVKQVSKQVKGGQARASALSPERRREIALLGVAARKKKREVE